MTPPHGPQPHAKLGFPWALVMALGVVLAVEIFLHTRDRLSLIAYATDEGHYHAVRDIVRYQGPAEVALVGSSQMREGVVMPTLIAELEKKLGRPVRVANYGLRGARPDAMNAVVRYLQKRPTPPKLIVVGIGPRDLRADTIDWPRVALFWGADDWFKAYKRYGFVATDLLPVVIRNEIGKVLFTLNFREEISLTLRRQVQRLGVDFDLEDGNNPMLGQDVYQHLGSRGERSLAKTTAPLRRLLQRAQPHYLFKLPAKPRRAMAGQTHELIDALGRTPGAALLVQMPVAAILQKQLITSGQAKTFAAFVGQQAAAKRVPFIPTADQQIAFTDNEFVDLQHLNRSGADRYSVWLANQIADRMSKGQ